MQNLPIYAAQGSLKKINYPSGSSTYFTYGEKFAKFPDYAGTGFLPYSSIAGGLNVLSMVTTDSLTGQKYSVSYAYEEGAANSTPYIDKTLAIGAQTYKSISLNSHYPLSTTQGSTVGYGKVTEEEFKYEVSSSDFIDKGKTEYYFTNPETDPDEIYSIDQPAIYYPGSPINDKDWKRGLLKEKKMYSSDSILSGNYTLQHTIKNEYDFIHDTLGKAMSGIIYTHAENSVNNEYRLIPYRLYKGRVQLSSILEKSYENGEVSSSFINIKYNKKNYLPAVTTTIIPSSEVVQETQSYASDVDHNSYILYPSLPVESLTFRKRPGEFILMKRQLNNYDAFGNITSIFGLNKDTAITDPTGFKYANITAGNIPSWENDPVGHLQPDRRYNQELALTRDIGNGGALMEQHSVSGLSETILWGYTKDHAQYPVAKIIGVNHTIASSLINQSLLDSAMYYSDARVRIELNKLRISLPDARIITYTYAPLIGVTSETDENGKTIYYEYDSFGRLIIVKDDQFNILKQICYNSDGSNGNCFESYYFSNEVSNSFIQINCGGVPGNSIVYKVPKGAYSSTLSQANANQKAIDDLNANGQAYANSQRKCPLYLNIEKSQSFTRNNCAGGPGNSIAYVVPANKYASTISQVDANQKALNDINDNGQAYANTHAFCPQIIPYARMSPINVYTDWYTDITYADIKVEFFRDQGCTIPYSVNNLLLLVDVITQYLEGGSSFIRHEFNCNNSSEIIFLNAIISGFDPAFLKTVSSRVFMFPPYGEFFGLN